MHIHPSEQKKNQFLGMQQEREIGRKPATDTVTQEEQPPGQEEKEEEQDDSLLQFIQDHDTSDENEREAQDGESVEEVDDFVYIQDFSSDSGGEEDESTGTQEDSLQQTAMATQHMWTNLSSRLSSPPDTRMNQTTSDDQETSNNDKDDNNRTFLERLDDLEKKGFLGNNDSILNEEDKAYLELLKILTDAGAPLTAFDDITTWAVLAAKKGIFKHCKDPPGRTVFLKKMAMYAGMEDLKPEKSVVQLPNAKIPLQVVRFDPVESLLSLMIDEFLWTENSLDLFQENGGIFSQPEFHADNPPDDHILKNFTSGTLAQRVYWKKVKQMGKETVIGFIVFIDKTHIVKGDQST